MTGSRRFAEQFSFSAPEPEGFMQLFVTDETNRKPDKNVRFFVYGGLIIPCDKLGELHRGIEAVRHRYGYKPGDALKFETHSTPEQVGPEKAKEAKREVVELCLSLDCKFIVHIILHDIIKNQDPDTELRRV